MLHFTDLIRTPRSNKELIYSAAAAALNPKGIPDGSMDQNWIYFFSPTHHLAQWHIWYSLEPRKDEGSEPMIIEGYYRNKEGNGWSLFQSTYGLWPCPSQQLANWLDKSSVQGAKGQSFLERPFETMQAANWSLSRSEPDVLLHQKTHLSLQRASKKEKSFMYGLWIMSCSGSSDAWKTKKQGVAFVLDMYWVSTMAILPVSV